MKRPSLGSHTRVWAAALLLAAGNLFAPAVAAQWIIVPNVEVEGYLFDSHVEHTFWIPAEVLARVTVRSQEFDPYLVILGPSGRIITQDDDSGGGLSAQVTWSPFTAGWHTAVVTSPGGGGRGAYTILLSQEKESALVGPNAWSLVVNDEGPDQGGVLPPGVWIEGRLRSGESQYYSSDVVTYTFAGEAGTHVSIVMESLDFDAYLRLYGPDGNELAANDDANEGRDAQIVLTLPVDGIYSVEASAYSGSGGFRIRRQHLPELHTVEGVLAEVDAHPAVGDGEQYFHDYVWTFAPGTAVTVWLQADFDAYLEVFDAEGTTYLTDDDSGGLLDARLTFTPSGSGDHCVRVTSLWGDGTGRYTLRVWSEDGPLGARWEAATCVED